MKEQTEKDASTALVARCSLTAALAAEVIRIRARGRPSPEWGVGQVIVTFLARGRRNVVVGDDCYTLSLTVTVHDFLLQFMKDRLGEEWGLGELEKPYAERHPILQWHGDNLTSWRKLRDGIPEGTPIGTPATSRMAALYSTAYDLFTVANNKLLDEKLLHR